MSVPLRVDHGRRARHGGSKIPGGDVVRDVAGDTVEGHGRSFAVGPTDGDGSRSVDVMHVGDDEVPLR